MATQKTAPRQDTRRSPTGRSCARTGLVGTLDGQQQRSCAHYEQAAAEQRGNQCSDASCFINDHFCLHGRATGDGPACVLLHKSGWGSARRSINDGLSRRVSSAKRSERHCIRDCRMPLGTVTSDCPHLQTAANLRSLKTRSVPRDPPQPLRASASPREPSFFFRPQGRRARRAANRIRKIGFRLLYGSRGTEQEPICPCALGILPRPRPSGAPAARA